MFKLTFSSINRLKAVHEVSVTGCENEHHAEMWGHHEAARLSLAHGEPLFLSHIFKDERNWVALGVPSFYMEGVAIMSSHLVRR